MEEEAIESVVVRVPEDHTSAAFHWHTLVELILWLTEFVGAARHLLAKYLIVEIQATTFDGAVCAFPEYLSLTEKLA